MFDWLRRKKPEITKTELGAMLDHAGLTEFRDRVLGMQTGSARLSVGARFAGDKTRASRFGGPAELPSDVSWPTRENRPLSFLAQINLEDLSNFRRRLALPQEGLLSFFYDWQEMPDGYDPTHRDGWRVFWFEGQRRLSIRETPRDLPGKHRIDPWQVEFREEDMFPSLLSREIDAFDFDDAQIDAYGGVWEAYCGGEPEHRLLGYPGPIQGDVRVECQLASNGIYIGDSKGYADPRVKQLEPGYATWRLLLQIDSDNSMGFNWGDAGRLYFCMTESDLLERAFDRVWLIAQCY